MNTVTKNSSTMNKRSPSVLTWFRIFRASHKLARAGDEHLRGWGLTGPQLGMLVRVGAEEGRTQQELACDLEVTKGNISQLVSKLERDGLIRREQRGASNQLFLTETGHRLLDEVLPDHDAFIEERFAALTQEEQAQLRTLLRKLERSLE
jgi:DNA-binding MarR family transcriptional regulator